MVSLLSTYIYTYTSDPRGLFAYLRDITNDECIHAIPIHIPIKHHQSNMIDTDLYTELLQSVNL